MQDESALKHQSILHKRTIITLYNIHVTLNNTQGLSKEKSVFNLLLNIIV